MQNFGRQDSNDSPKIRGVDVRPFLWMTTSAVLFAAMNTAVRIASESAPTALIATARAFFGFLVAWGYAKSQGFSLPRKHAPSMWLRSLFGSLAMAATFYTLGQTALPLGDAATLFNLSPIGVALLSPWVLREPKAPGLIPSLCLSLLGVVLVVKPTFLFGTPHAYGIATAGWAVAAAALSSLAMVSLRMAGRREHPTAIAAHFSLVATVGFGLVTVVMVSQATLLHVSARAWIWMTVAGVCAGIAQLTMTRAYAQDNAARVSAFGYLNVVASALLGAWVSGVWPTALSVLGMCAVVTGGVLLLLMTPRALGAPRPSK